MQVSPSEVLVECHSTGVMLPINSDIHIRGIYVTKVYSNRLIVIMRIGFKGQVFFFLNFDVSKPIVIFHGGIALFRVQRSP